jgi:two-component SAPR family response regulator
MAIHTFTKEHGAAREGVFPLDPRLPFGSDSDHFPVRIYVLGRFAIQHRNPSAAHVSRKAQHKPLQLLKALIAFGGRDVSEDALTHALWPDAEGDRALVAFDTTLHRLRRMLGTPGALTLFDRKLTLSSNHCWVDSWAVERLMHVLDRSFQDNRASEQEVAALSTQIENLYHGAFLGSDTPSAWSISLRERLRSRYLRYVTNVGRFWEAAAHHERAIELYRKGLETDSLMEHFYQRLMHCHLQLEQRAEALAVYYRCERVLSKLLGIRPSKVTESLRIQAQSAA